MADDAERKEFPVTWELGMNIVVEKPLSWVRITNIEIPAAERKKQG